MHIGCRDRVFFHRLHCGQKAYLGGLSRKARGGFEFDARHEAPDFRVEDAMRCKRQKCGGYLGGGPYQFA